MMKHERKDNTSKKSQIVKIIKSSKQFLKNKITLIVTSFIVVILMFMTFSSFMNTTESVLKQRAPASTIMTNLEDEKSIEKETQANATVVKPTQKTETETTQKPTKAVKPTETQYKTITQVKKYSPSEICLIGDSRTVCMENAVISDYHFICETSMGLDWLINEAEPKLDKIQDQVKVCVILLGINDVYNQDSYIEEYNNLTKKYPHIKFIYSTVGPVEEGMEYEITNSEIEDFNDNVVSGLNEKWSVLDTYKHLAAEGFETWDGIHYTDSVSSFWLSWIIDQVGSYEVKEKVPVSD